MTLTIYDTIIRPVVTEKSTTASSHTTERRGAAYTFEVHPDASKTQIRHAVERLYRVKVEKVNTLGKKGHRKRFRFTVGMTKPAKRAVVYVASGQAIELF